MNYTAKTCAVLLMLAGPAVSESDPDASMRSLTSGFLTDLSGPQNANTTAAVENTANLEELIQQAVSEGQSDAYLDALLSEAVDKGEIEVSDGMRNTEGDVDTRVLLASLVEKSLNDRAEPALANEASGAAEVPVKDQYYKVQPGDSLAAIAITYYDSAKAYSRIFEANRDTLSSPDRISVGQVLLIPG